MIVDSVFAAYRPRERAVALLVSLSDGKRAETGSFDMPVGVARSLYASLGVSLDQADHFSRGSMPVPDVAGGTDGGERG